MGSANDAGKAKWYVVSFNNGRMAPRIACGWPAVLQQRKRAGCGIRFQAFHTYEAAEKHMLELRSLR